VSPFLKTHSVRSLHQHQVIRYGGLIGIPAGKYQWSMTANLSSRNCAPSPPNLKTILRRMLERQKFNARSQLLVHSMVSQPQAPYLLHNELDIFIVKVYFLVGFKSSHLEEKEKSYKRDGCQRCSCCGRGV
jgi:hypothetical protein